MFAISIIVAYRFCWGEYESLYQSKQDGVLSNETTELKGMSINSITLMEDKESMFDIWIFYSY